MQVSTFVRPQSAAVSAYVRSAEAGGWGRRRQLPDDLRATRMRVGPNQEIGTDNLYHLCLKVIETNSIYK